MLWFISHGKESSFRKNRKKVKKRKLTVPLFREQELREAHKSMNTSWKMKGVQVEAQRNSSIAIYFSQFLSVSLTPSMEERLEEV